MNRKLLVLLVCCGVVWCAATRSKAAVNPSDAELNKRANDVLARALQDGQKWVKVHAAESLIWDGQGGKVVPVFKREAELFSTEPEYRIGIWRVLAQATETPGEKDQYVQKIVAALRDPNGPDTLHATETLGKLNYIISAGDRPRVEHLAKTLPGKGMPFTRWLLALAGGADDVRRVAELLDHEDPEIRGNTAFTLRYLRNQLPPDVVERIQKVADKEPPSDWRMFIVGLAYVTAKEPSTAAKYREQLLPYLAGSTVPQRFAAATLFSIGGDRGDLPRLAAMLEDPELDAQVAAANAILAIQKRSGEKK